MNFGPQTAEEAEIFAVEELRAEIQYEILRALRDSRMTQAQLAKKLGISPAAVSQFLDDDANLKLETVARVFLALGCQLQVRAQPCASHFEEAVKQAPQDNSKSVWHFEDQDTEVGQGDTAAMLLRVIRKNANSQGLKGKLSNDNSLYKKLAVGVA